MWRATQMRICSSTVHIHRNTVVTYSLPPRQLPFSRTWQRMHGTHHHHKHHHHHHHHSCHHNPNSNAIYGSATASSKGMRITTIGLMANMGLTITKAVAGCVMNSASLLADAAHSMSDLASDFVTLFSYKISRRPADALYPHGYGKYETLGSIAVSSLLVTGAIGVGIHSFDLLQSALQVTVQDVAVHAHTHTHTHIHTTESPSLFSAIPSMLFHDHHHHHGDSVLDPNAAWVALGCMLVKGWLYQATLKIGKSENSEVLIANAWHHRADSFSSGMALVAILGTHTGIPILDPLAGLAVAGLLFKGAARIFTNSFRELMDRGIQPGDMDKVLHALASVKEKEKGLIHFHTVRGRKLGPFYHIDMVLQVDPGLNVQDVQLLQQRLKASLKHDCQQVQEVFMQLDTSPVLSSPQHHVKQ